MICAHTTRAAGHCGKSGLQKETKLWFQHAFLMWKVCEWVESETDRGIAAAIRADRPVPIIFLSHHLQSQTMAFLFKCTFPRFFVSFHLSLQENKTVHLTDVKLLLDFSLCAIPLDFSFRSFLSFSKEEKLHRAVAHVQFHNLIFLDGCFFFPNSGTTN